MNLKKRAGDGHQQLASTVTYDMTPMNGPKASIMEA